MPAPSGDSGTPTAPVTRANQTYHVGARGLLRRVWYGTHIPRFLFDAPTYTEVESVQPTGISLESRLDYYAQELRGFFVPPFSANYSFYARGDDYISLFLGTNTSSHPSGERMVASLPSWCTDFNCNPSTQLGKPVWLEGGKPLWFRMTHQEGTGDDWA